MKFVLLINLKLLITKSLLLDFAEHETFSANKYEKANYYWHFPIFSSKIFMIIRVEHEKSLITSGPGLNPQPDSLLTVPRWYVCYCY